MVNTQGRHVQHRVVHTDASNHVFCRRCGVLAVKAGMMQDWDEWGARVPLTVLWIDDCQVCLSGMQAPFLAQL